MLGTSIYSKRAMAPVPTASLVDGLFNMLVSSLTPPSFRIISLVAGSLASNYRILRESCWRASFWKFLLTPVRFSTNLSRRFLFLNR